MPRLLKRVLALAAIAAVVAVVAFVTLSPMVQKEAAGRREGRFKAIRLHARGADVELRSVRVIYTNGQPDDLPTRHFLRQGGYTPPLDLRGWERAIDRVDMVYKTVPNFKGIATVCVEGLQ